MTVIRLGEAGHADDGAFDIKVSFGDDAEYMVRVADPADPAGEAELAWYFQDHLRYPFLDKDREQQAVRQIGAYGEALFGQVFGGAANHDYRSLRERSFDGCRLEISGSAALHRLHWEALRDPDLDSPIAVRMPVTRRVEGQASRFALPDPRPTVNIVVVTARPDGPRDVGYRTISRPLLDALRTAGLPVTVDLVRPGTWEALRDHMRSATKRHGSGWYHIVHFDLHGAFRDYGSLAAGRQAGRLLFSPATLAAYDGRRGFLFFETTQENTAEPVPAERVASLLAEHRVPVAVLNACQSAMQSDSEAGLAQQLAEAGVPVAVGMAYSVTVSAAERAMPVLYRGVADGDNLTAAVTAARRALREHQGRRVYFGQDLDLEDWVLPVMFAQRPLRIDLRPMTDPELAGFYERQAVVADEPATEYGFVGRDLDIQAIEHRLLATRGGGQLLVQGMAGAGKSTLLVHMAWWWQRTGLADRVFRFSYEDRAWTAGQIIRQIRSELMSPAEHARADVLSEAAQAEQLAGLLRAGRHLLILDNAESITAAPAAIPHTLDADERDKLRRFLAKLHGGRTLVLLGSRGTEDWLTAGQGPGIYPLPGLDPQAASLLVDKILDRHGATRWLDDHAERPALQELVTLLGGYPLPLTVVLPVLAHAPPTQVLAELQTGEQGADPAGLIRRAIEYSHGKLDPALQHSLQLLAPFTAVIGTGEFLVRYQELLGQDEAVQALGTIDLPTALTQAISVGLAAPHPQLNYLVQVQPVLPWFLRSRLRDQGALAAAAQQAHYLFYQDFLARLLHEMLTSGGDPERRIAGMAAAQAEYANLTAALDHGLRTGQPIRSLVDALDEYLDQAQLHDTRRQFLDDAIAAYPEPVTRQQLGELAQLHDLAGHTAVTQRRLSDAGAHYQTALRLRQAAGERHNEAITYHQLGLIAQQRRGFADAEASYRQALDIKLELGERHSAAITYHQLGSVAQEQRQFADAEASYRQALDIYLEFGDRHSAASTYQNLGAIAQHQERFANAEASYRQALDIYLEFDDRHRAASAYHQLGVVAQHRERFADAEASYRQALDIFLEFGDRYGAASTYHQLGVVAQDRERFADAEASYRQALDIFLEFGDRHRAASTYHNLGVIAQHQERFADAEASYRQALDIYLEFGDRYETANIYHQLGIVARHRERFADAEASYRQALEIYLEFDDARGAAGTYHSLSSLAKDQNRFENAAEYYRLALDIQRQSDPRGASSTATQLGIVLAQLDKHTEAAAVLLYAAMSWREETGQWDPEDLRLLNQERTVLGSGEFTKLIKANVPAGVADDLAEAMKR
jgi:tetratricopeptide (TPR) repeat protein